MNCGQMNFSVVAGFLLLSVPAFFTPGPNNLMLMTSSAKFGFRLTVPHAMGIVLGFPFMVFAVGLGLAEVFTAFPVIKTVMKYAAALYFLWMAWHLLGLKIGEGKASARPMRTYEAGLFQWVNPKAWAMATSIVAAYVVPGDMRMTSLLLVTFGCMALSPFSSLLWMVFGGQLQAFLVRTHSERFLGLILALLMCVAVILFLI